MKAKKHDIDIYRQPIPIIPAFTYGWRVGCAVKVFIIMLPIAEFIGALIALKMTLEQFATSSNPIRLLEGYFFYNSTMFGIAFFIVFMLSLFTYSDFSKFFYRWWYSVGP